MTIDLNEINCGTYGFHFLDDLLNPVSKILTIGIENITSTDYYLDSSKRKDLCKYIFQYTLSGSGLFIYKNIPYEMLEGQAFLAEVPGDNIYYLPKESKGWKFIYITLSGTEVIQRWPEIVEAIGCTGKFDKNSPLIKYLFSIYKEAEAEKITDCYQASALAYGFLMELYRTVKKCSIEKYPELINKAIHIITENFNALYGIEEVAEKIGVSKFYLIRLFTRNVGITPGKYITKIRLEKSLELLHNTSISIEEIARTVGYSNGNYFIKVFRYHLGMSPGEFRTNKEMLPYTYMKL